MEKPQDKPPCNIERLIGNLYATRFSGTPKSHYFNGKKWPEGQENKESQYMKLTIHGFYIAIVICNSNIILSALL